MIENKYKETVGLLLQTNRLHRKLAERRAATMNLQPSQHRMLMYLSRTEAVPSQCEIAKKFEISPAAVANTLKKLEKMGYVEKTRATDSGDARVNEIKITEQGMSEAHNTCEYFSYIDTAMFKDFSDDEIYELQRLLLKASSNLQNTEEFMERECSK